MDQTIASRAFLYGRHSTDKQDLTQEVQLDICKTYYERVLKPHGVQFAGWFYDEAITSAIPFGEREYGRIVMVSLQPGDHLVAAKLSRTFRSLVDGTSTLAQLDRRGVKVHDVELPVDRTTSPGRLVSNVKMSVDQYYREQASEHQLEIIRYRQSQGLPFSRGVPIGWKNFGEKPHRVWRVDMQERTLAFHIAGLKASGMSLEQIALWGFRQTQFPNKRQFTHRDAVQWVLHAAARNFPKITGYKRFRSMVAKGEI